jgi:hypothetical protein
MDADFGAVRVLADFVAFLAIVFESLAWVALTDIGSRPLLGDTL